LRLSSLKYFLLCLAIVTIFAADLPAETIRQSMEAGIKSMGSGDDDDLNFPLFDNTKDKNAGGKSKWKALGFSLLLPGAGQYYTESRNRTIIFGSAEALVWSGFFGFRTYGSWKKEDYRAWAALKAGAIVDGKDENFFEKLTYYDNLDEYNQFELLYEGSQAVVFPDTREYYWNWDSDTSRNHFRDLRNQSKAAYRRSLLFLGAAVANRILAGIDAFRAASSYSKRDEFSDGGWNLYYTASSLMKDGEVEIGITKQF